MTTSEAINLAAIILGPILAVQVQKWIEKINADTEKRRQIFKTLMATRGATLSQDHVQALNRIDLEFPNTGKHKKVLSAWKEYFDNLSQDVSAISDNQLQIWSNANRDLLVALLYEMGVSLGYSFDKALIKRNIYTPSGHYRDENEIKLLRHELLHLLRDGVIPMSIERVDSSATDKESLDRQKEVQELMIKYYNAKLKDPDKKD